MICRTTSFLRRFKRDENGNAVVEFALLVPIFIFFMMAAVEVGMMSIRNTMLERGLDQTVRWIRLNTGAAPTHNELKQMICAQEVVPDCMENLQLEMVRRDIRNWQALPTEVSCTDRALDVQPMANLSFGMDNELMILRACAKYEPIFPSTWFTNELTLDESGDARLIAMTAFVQEPR
jgi:Flp pilus assembly pilin Flp